MLAFLFVVLNFSPAYAGSGVWGSNCTVASNCSGAYPLCGFGPSGSGWATKKCYCNVQNPANGGCCWTAPTFTQDQANNNCQANYGLLCNNLQTGFCITDNNTNYCAKPDIDYQYCTSTSPANMLGSSTTSMIPVASAVSLIFVAFFVGILLSYVIYKCRKSSLKQKYDTAQTALSESSHRSTEESQVGDKPLNLSPLSEQV